MAQATLWAMVEPPEPPLARDEGDGAADRGGVLAGEEIADGGDDGRRGGRQHDVFGNAGADQLAIEQHVVDVAEDDQPGRGVADLGKPLERSPESRPGGRRGLDDDQVGRRVGLVGLDRAVDAAIVRGQRDLAHAAVVDRGLDQLGGLRMLAERLDGDARNEARAGRDLGRRLFGRRCVLS